MAIVDGLDVDSVHHGLLREDGLLGKAGLLRKAGLAETGGLAQPRDRGLAPWLRPRPPSELKTLDRLMPTAEMPLHHRIMTMRLFLLTSLLSF